MRRLCGWLCAAALLAGCVETTYDRYGNVTTPPDGPSSSEIRAKCDAWVEELALEGIKPANHRGRTLFLVKQLNNSRPHSIAAVLEHGVGHANAKVRENSAFFLGSGGGAKAEEALINLLEDDVDAVRYSAAASLLLGYAVETGVPHLLEALRSGEAGFRREAVKSLRAHFKQYFAFDPKGPPAEREFAAKKWDEWWGSR